MYYVFMAFRQLLHVLNPSEGEGEGEEARTTMSLKLAECQVAPALAGRLPGGS